MFLRQTVLVFLGISAGGIVAAGVFAFLTMIGIFPRLIGKAKIRNHMMWCETAIIAGGISGNVADLYPIAIPWSSHLFLGIMGICIGIFVGCLVMSLAETLKSLPIMNRRIHLAVGFQYLIFSIGMGKCFGSLVYFSRRMGD